MDDLLNGFGTIEQCPACGDGLYDKVMRYCEAGHMRAKGEEHRFVTITNPIQEAVAHLHINCNKCGYEWLEHPKSAGV